MKRRIVRIKAVPPDRVYGRFFIIGILDSLIVANVGASV
jgi:hypothetical protein